jgi:hypothetical protein
VRKSSSEKLDHYGENKLGNVRENQLISERQQHGINNQLISERQHHSINNQLISERQQHSINNQLISERLLDINNQLISERLLDINNQLICDETTGLTDSVSPVPTSCVVPSPPPKRSPVANSADPGDEEANPADPSEGRSMDVVFYSLPKRNYPNHEYRIFEASRKHCSFHTFRGYAPAAAPVSQTPKQPRENGHLNIVEVTDLADDLAYVTTPSIGLSPA